MRLFVKAKQVMKHCLEKEKIALNYDAAEFDGAMILSAQSPTTKRSATPVPPVPPANRNAPPPPKDFMCSIWFVELVGSLIR